MPNLLCDTGAARFKTRAVPAVPEWLFGQNRPTARCTLLGRNRSSRDLAGFNTQMQTNKVVFKESDI